MTNRRSCYCIARWCNNNNVNSKAMFRLPKGERGRTWLLNADRSDLLSLDEGQLHRRYLCSDHFTPDCFLKPNLLTWNAVPTLFNTVRVAVQESQPSCAQKMHRFTSKTNGVIKKKQSENIPKKFNVNEKLLPQATKVPVLSLGNGFISVIEAPMNLANVMTSNVTKNCSKTLSNKSNNKCKFGARLASTKPVLLPKVASTSPKNVSQNIKIKTEESVLNNAELKSKLMIMRKETIKPNYPSSAVNEQITSRENKNDNLNSNVTTHPNYMLPLTSSQNLSEVCLTESEQSTFMDDFTIMEKESVLSCSCCGEVFLVESGLTHHMQRYHSVQN